jgi:8-oxo-dGTP pyrophosphatase MutT (NUDIX family)
MKLETRYSAGLAIVWNKKVLLLHTTGRGTAHSYGIPKGGIDGKESNLDAALRETDEECGIVVPSKLVDKNEHTFVVTSRKYKYNKVVTYFIVEVKDLKDIGLKGPDISKSQLQLEEVDIAGFYDYREAMKLIMKSQAPVITKLLSKGLI